MIRGIFQWLSDHRLINFLLVISYVLFLIFAHDSFVNLSVVVMNSLSLPVYNRVVATTSLIVLLALIGLIYRAFNSKMQVDKQGFLFASLVLSGLVFHFFVFTEMNIEFIHAMEFGLLSAIIYPLFGRYGAAIICALPVMLVDEWYQYIILYPDYVEYFDLNDILLDLLGAGLFLSIVKLFLGAPKSQPLSLFRRPELYILLSMVGVTIILLATSQVVPYTNFANENTWLVLNAIKIDYAFWRVHPVIGSTYHVLEPIYGLITVFGVCLIYLAMDLTRSPK
ncbi:MAG: hypothetical protein K9J17_10550 [Flavobacteriales bacterium]|nr:hypothetical protein [Flavobacteriales bacterium]